MKKNILINIVTTLFIVIIAIILTAFKPLMSWWLYWPIMVIASIISISLSTFMISIRDTGNYNHDLIVKNSGEICCMKRDIRNLQTENEKLKKQLEKI